MATASGESFDTSLVKVPFESLRRTTRERKYAVDELASVTADLAKAAAESGGAGGRAANNNSDNSNPAAELLGSLAARVRKLKRSLEEASRAEELDAARVRARVEHVALGTSGSSNNDASAATAAAAAAAASASALDLPERGSLVPWTSRRLDRMVADDLARRGRSRTARALRDSLRREGEEESPLDLLVDWECYSEAAPAIDALLTPPSPNTNSSSPSSKPSSDFDRAEPALEWCRRHAARLRKLRSALPFRLRLQQFVGLAAAGNAVEALRHARKFLAPHALGAAPATAAASASASPPPPTVEGARLAELQRGVALLVVLGVGGGGGGAGTGKSSSSCALSPLLLLPEAVRSRYGDLLAGEGAWRSLARLMRAEVARVHEMSSRSQLSLQVAAGLVALKPPPGAGFSLEGATTTAATTTATATTTMTTTPSSSSRDDPLSSAPLAALASTLPHAKRLHSQLVCGLTGRIMDHENPPAALPCGATFSEAGLKALAGSDGCVECPLHGGEREGRTPLSQLRRVFVS